MGESTDLLQQGKFIQQLEDTNKKLVAENDELRARPAWWLATVLVLLALYGGYRLGNVRAVAHAAQVCGRDCTEILATERADKQPYGAANVNNRTP